MDARADGPGRERPRGRPRGERRIRHARPLLRRLRGPAARSRPSGGAAEHYGGIDVENRLGEVTHPVLVLAGRHDRTCAAGASEDMAARLPDAELVVFENSAHMMFAEEQDRYLATVRRFLDRITS